MFYGVVFDGDAVIPREEGEVTEVWIVRREEGTDGLNQLSERLRSLGRRREKAKEEERVRTRSVSSRLRSSRAQAAAP